MKLVIIDDDLQFAKGMKRDLILGFSHFVEEVDVDIISSDFDQIKNLNQYLFYFIDIDLQSVSGLKLASEIQAFQRKCFVVFVSARNDLIHETYDVRAYYFIRKTNYKKDLNVFYSIVRNEFKEEVFVQLNYKNKKCKLSLNRILYLESQDHKVRLVTSDQEYYDNRTLKKWYEILPKEIFIQIHRSFIVNINHLITYQNNNLIMINNESLKIGRNYKKSFDLFYQDYLIR